ncbi:MAG: hypothetical protein K2W85_17405 [Phycisphaerales bacterium]|nr:hypothetical protein [Phycisphaerales bacterium]
MNATALAIRWLLDTLGGLWELLRLGVVTGFRFNGPYWTWRTQTAFGRGWPDSRAQRIGAILEYARWIRRMRRQM